MTKTIPLTRGQVAIVDDADYGLLSRHKWHALKPAGTYYATRRDGTTRVYMHRVILGTASFVDHINGNGLDNRRSNLRPATRSQNQWNRGALATNTSGYKGVCLYKPTGMWQAQITSSGKVYYLGRYSDAEDAARAYNNAAVALHGSRARLNEIPQ